MSYPLGHSAAGLVLYRYFLPAGGRGWNLKDLALVVCLTNLPDLDIVAGLCSGNGNLFHRGPTHNLFFAFLVALILPWWISFRNSTNYWRVFTLCFLLLLSHAALDGIVDPAHLAFFWPLQPFQPVGVRGFADTVQEVVAVSQKDTVIATIAFLLLFYRPLWTTIRASLRRQTFM